MGGVLTGSVLRASATSDARSDYPHVDVQSKRVSPPTDSVSNTRDDLPGEWLTGSGAACAQKACSGPP
jgi:hypothetical protein